MLLKGKKMEQDNDIEIVEPENYFSSKAERFSNGELVMMAFRKCIELGAKEMREGYYNTKQDKSGNINYIYIPDTRKEFIEAVETLLMIMADDIDEPTQKELTAIMEGEKNEDGTTKKIGLVQKYKSLCLAEKQVWDHANIKQKQFWNSKNIFYRDGMLSSSLPFATDYLIAWVKASREVVGVLKKRIKALNYYAEGSFVG